MLNRFLFVLIIPAFHNPEMSLQLSAIKILTDSNFNEGYESLSMFLSVMNLDLTIRVDPHLILTAESSYKDKDYYESWEPYAVHLYAPNVYSRLCRALTVNTGGGSTLIVKSILITPRNIYPSSKLEPIKVLMTDNCWDIPGL
ncbi:hypothetical protein ACOSQ4_000341 [Xanthoceras sorbifolium]